MSGKNNLDNTSVEIENTEGMIEMEEDNATEIPEDNIKKDSESETPEENVEDLVEQFKNEEQIEDIVENLEDNTETIENIEEITEEISRNQNIPEEDIEEEAVEPMEAISRGNIEDISTDTNKLKNQENAYIISGYKNGVTVFLETSSLDLKSAEWTKNLLEAKIYIESDLEKLLFLLKELYFETEEIVNIDIRKFHWEKHNSLNRYFSDLENKLEVIKNKMTDEEYEFLLKYKDKL